MSVVDYINEFERLFNKTCQSDIILPIGVHQYKVLNKVNIASEKKQWIRATVVTLTYENVIKQLNIIYDSFVNSVNDNDNLDKV